MADDVMKEILDIAKKAGVQTESVVTTEQNKRSLEIDLVIIYDVIHSLNAVANLLRSHNLHKELSPHATDNDEFVERTYHEECDIIKQYLKSIRDRIRRSLKKIEENK